MFLWENPYTASATTTMSWKNTDTRRDTSLTGSQPTTLLSSDTILDMQW